MKEQKNEEAIPRDQEAANFPELEPASEPMAVLLELLRRGCCHPPRWLEPGMTVSHCHDGNCQPLPGLLLVS